MRKVIWKVWEPVADYLFPPVCAHCRQFHRIDEYLCEHCRDEAFQGSEKAVHPKPGVVSMFRLNPVILTLVHGMKYGGMKGIPAYLANHADDSFWQSPLLQEIGRRAFVPVPLHPARLRERGYNQAELIATSLQQRLGGAVMQGVLKRRRYSKSQTEMNEEQRKWNVAGAFVARPPAPYSLLLVDDVYTTGATTRSCQIVLEQVGVQIVRVITLAFEPAKQACDDWRLDLERWGNKKV